MGPKRPRALAWLLTSCVEVALCDGECVNALVQFHADMAFDEHPIDFVPVGLGQQLLPKIAVLHRLLLGLLLVWG